MVVFKVYYGLIILPITKPNYKKELKIRDRKGKTLAKN
jgi:hypothetical protein